MSSKRRSLQLNVNSSFYHLEQKHRQQDDQPDFYTRQRSWMGNLKPIEITQ